MPGNSPVDRNARGLDLKGLYAVAAADMSPRPATGFITTDEIVWAFK